MSAERDALAADIAACRRCPGPVAAIAEPLNKPGRTGSAPGYGCENAPVMLVGQSLCRRCMATGVPFTGGSEWLIKRALTAAGLVKADLFVTNVVHCHPPDDRGSEQHEKANCAEYLRRELALVRPLLIVGLGGDAHDALTAEYRAAPVLRWQPFTPPTTPPPVGPVLLLLDHPSHVKFWPAAKRQEWIDGLTAALRWGFGQQTRTPREDG
ncbi:MAG: uracil-DNA glycosylase [Mycobacterium sp.]